MMSDDFLSTLLPRPPQQAGADLNAGMSFMRISGPRTEVLEPKRLDLPAGENGHRTFTLTLRRWRVTWPGGREMIYCEIPFADLMHRGGR